MTVPDIYTHSERQLYNFIENKVLDYSDLRNYDSGPKQPTSVSQLSPYISHRVLLEYDIVNQILAKHPLLKTEKYIQEIFWRIYWKGWLELRPNVWTDFVKESSADNQSQAYLDAINAETDIDFFNAWVEELKEYNYLHNHARMWFASIWIFTLKLPWQLGASFFLANLYDGDPASNTLSWRWVAGLQTKGKNYLATKSNIEKYSNITVGAINLIDNAAPLVESYQYPIQPLSHNPKLRSRYNNLLIFETELNQQHSKVDYASYENIFVLLLGNNKRQIKLSKKVLTFKSDLVKSFQIVFRTPQIIDTNFIENYCQSGKELDVIYPSVGDNLDYLVALQSTFKASLNMIFRNNDIYCWQFANKGYFNFKKNIADILKQTSQDGNR